MEELWPLEENKHKINGHCPQPHLGTLDIAMKSYA